MQVISLEEQIGRIYGLRFDFLCFYGSEFFRSFDLITFLFLLKHPYRLQIHLTANQNPTFGSLGLVVASL